MLNNLMLLGNASSSSSGVKILNILIITLVWLAVFYFLFILPNKKKSKRHNNLLKDLKKGDSVLTVGGIKGEVAEIEELFIQLKVDAKGNRLTFKKTAISQILK